MNFTGCLFRQGITLSEVVQRRKWQPTPVLLPGKFHGWRNLIGYSPWGHKESDTTEQFHFKVGIRVRVKVTFKIEVRIKFRVEDRPRLGVNSEKAMAPHSSTLA